MNETPFIDIHSHSKSKTLNVYKILSLNLNEIQDHAPHSIGFHPWFLNSESEINIDKLKGALNHPKCVALGECGLDKVCDVDFKLQEKVFTLQLEAAKSCNKRLVFLHCVKSYFEILSMITPYLSQMTFIFHDFILKPQHLPQFNHPKIFFSLGRNLEKDRSSLNRSLSLLPIAKIFLETDDSTKEIQERYLLLSKKLGITEKELREQLFRNFCSLGLDDFFSNL